MRALLAVIAHIEICRVHLILALRFPSSSERLNGFFGFVERGFSLRFAYPRLFWFTGTFWISLLEYRLAYADGLLLLIQWRTFQSAQFGSFGSDIRTFLWLFDCLWFFSNTMFPLSSCISTFNILSLTCKAPKIYFCRRFITFAESRGAGCVRSIHFTRRNKKAACSHAGRSFACSHAGRSFD